MNDIDILKTYFKGEALEDALIRYEKGEPAAYIAGEWEFYGDRYFIDRNCLIPRCDTERLVDKLLEKLPENGTFADLCTGCGCISISALKRRPYSTATALDISQGALRMAKKNAELNGVDNRIEFIQGDIAQFSFPPESFDVIVSNPPYIPTADLETLDVYVKHEPATALDGGHDGMDFYRVLLDRYFECIKPKGYMLLEIGSDGEHKIKMLAEQKNLKCDVLRDYSGNPRVAVIIK